MVLLAGLPLVSCTEKIITVSISGYNKVSKKSSSTPLTRYRNRPESMRNLSLHEFFFECNKNKKERHIPHYVGASTVPRYPFSESFARCMLIIHKPWHGSTRVTPNSNVEELQEFLECEHCPKSLKLSCARAKERHINGSKFKEPTAGNEESGGTFGFDGIDQETQDLMEFITTFSRFGGNNDGTNQQSFHRGMDFDWGKKLYPNRDPRKQDGSWIQDQIKNFHDAEENSKTKKHNLRVPKKTDDTGKKRPYSVKDCNDSQKDILFLILDKLKEYFEKGKSECKDKTFTPLRMTIMGEAGTGKSFLINAITSIVRTMFQENDVVQVTGPTGMMYDFIHVS